MDTDKSDTFGERMLDLVTGNVLTMLIAIGHRTGLFDATAEGPANAVDLAVRAGLDERYVREWLGAMVTGAILSYDATTGRYSLPDEHRPFLTGNRVSNIGPAAGMLANLGVLLPEVQRCFFEGGGVPHSAFASVAGPTLGEQWQRVYDEQLISGFLPAVPGLVERLRIGARVLDLGCGTGHAINLMAQAFPASRFVGLDLSPDAIGLAEAERASMGLANASFTVADATTLAADGSFDVITAFDAVHDQREPDEVLRRIRGALTPDGVFVMVDVNLSSDLESNLGNPFAALSYGVSLLYCVPTCRADGGAALGALWGRELAASMLADAGFDDVHFHDSPRPQNYVAACRFGRAVPE